MVMDHIFVWVDGDPPKECECGEKEYVEPQSKEVVHKTPKSLEVPVAEFEGEWIRKMTGKLQALTLEMPVGYARGTHLKLELEVRVRDVSIRELKDGALYREHTFALEEIKLLGAYSADEMDPGVGGSAAVGAEDEEEGKGDDGTGEYL